jgi:hypothetical protein
MATMFGLSYSLQTTMLQMRQSYPIAIFLFEGDEAG